MKILTGILTLTVLCAALEAQEPPAKPLPTRTRCRQTLSVKP